MIIILFYYTPFGPIFTTVIVVGISKILFRTEDIDESCYMCMIVINESTISLSIKLIFSLSIKLIFLF